MEIKFLELKELWNAYYRNHLAFHTTITNSNLNTAITSNKITKFDLDCSLEDFRRAIRSIEVIGVKISVKLIPQKNNELSDLFMNLYDNFFSNMRLHELEVIENLCIYDDFLHFQSYHIAAIKRARTLAFAKSLEKQLNKKSQENKNIIKV